MKLYKSYHFRNKDPIIDRLRTIIADQKMPWARIERESGVCTATLNGWFRGKTKRPQHATVAAVAAVLGYELVLAPKSGAQIIPLHRKVAGR